MADRRYTREEYEKAYKICQFATQQVNAIASRPIDDDLISGLINGCLLDSSEPDFCIINASYLIAKMYIDNTLDCMKLQRISNIFSNNTITPEFNQNGKQVALENLEEFRNKINSFCISDIGKQFLIEWFKFIADLDRSTNS